MYENRQGEKLIRLREDFVKKINLLIKKCNDKEVFSYI